MKTLLITTLTTALLSFNSFAGDTADIKNMASLMAKTGLHQLNTQLKINTKAKTQQAIMTLALTTNNNAAILVANIPTKNNAQIKHTAQVMDE
ncbi:MULTISPECIES: hypothetical protein [unclassified Colwellia]|uniref:hypothetical protein n=1 Tax=unclassified Colwellia TaxID=196834 RepID=UPI0015F62EAD|nr:MULTISPECIES: hypothetical protein [unclassified Colwellia]MBA6232368.1 hypothetical protein [Colwellia sp. MB02u-7]MBA6236044.1 hypothetical protein [Colwellia sp. MB02u-11]MBA6256702.1 hypothetical protein [Colwellia sp. MB3u-28]MBA6261417.1 hypothetical protein [Colwellia sp. MB3u-41]MBA6298551.1 hypothetical protein [Colwellia sp. MB3u-22]